MRFLNFMSIKSISYFLPEIYLLAKQTGFTPACFHVWSLRLALCVHLLEAVVEACVSRISTGRDCNVSRVQCENHHSPDNETKNVHTFLYFTHTVLPALLVGALTPAGFPSHQLINVPHLTAQVEIGCRFLDKNEAPWQRLQLRMAAGVSCWSTVMVDILFIHVNSIFIIHASL